jgi:hypothetical protein
MAVAELKTKATMDTTAYNKGADEVKAKAQEVAKAQVQASQKPLNAAEELRNKNKELAKQYLQLLSPIALVIAGVRGISTVIQDYVKRGEDLEKNAKQVKVSADYYAMVHASAKAAGVGVDEFNEAMKRVVDGKDSILELEQKWNGTADGIERAKIAMENFEALALKNAKGGLAGVGQSISSTIAFGVDAMMGGKGTRNAAFRSVVQSGDYTTQDFDRIRGAIESQGIRFREGDDMMLRKIIEDVRSEREKIRADERQAKFKREEETLRGYVKQAGGDIGMAYSAYKTSYGAQAVSENAFRFAVSESTTKEKEFADALQELKESIEARKKANDEATKKQEEFDKWAKENREKGTAKLEKYNEAIAQENKGFAEELSKIVGAIPASYGFTSSGGDIVGRERSSYNARMAKEDRALKVAEASEKHLQRLEKIEKSLEE